MKFIVERISNKLSDILREIEKANKMRRIELKLKYGSAFTDEM